MPPSRRCAKRSADFRRFRRLCQPPNRRTEPAEFCAADELAPMQLREFACGWSEFVVGDDHGSAAVLHGRTRDKLLDGACADWPRLSFALNSKAIGAPADD